MQLLWVAGDDPLKIEAFEKMPVWEYLLIVDKIIGEQLRKKK